MQLFETSFYLKFCAFIRYLIIIFFLKRIKIKNVSYIGFGLKLFAEKNASITINGKINIRNHVELQSKGQLNIGTGCGINSFSRIIAFEKITLGNKVSIAQFVSILDHDHSYEIEDEKINLSEYKIKPIRIGNNVWIGDKVTITKGVTIGDNVVIGANSVVTKDIPSNSIAAGIPAEVLKKLDLK